MFSLNDPRWSTLEGGYRTPYDARPLLARFTAQSELSDCWDEVWNELHHQGDIGEASYAVLPRLVEIFETQSRDYNLYAYAAILEQCRGRGANPDVPDWLSKDYRAAQTKLLDLAIADIRSGVGEADLAEMLAFIAGYGGAPGLSAVLMSLDQFEGALRILGHYKEIVND